MRLQSRQKRGNDTRNNGDGGGGGGGGGGREGKHTDISSPLMNISEGRMIILPTCSFALWRFSLRGEE